MEGADSSNSLEINTYFDGEACSKTDNSSEMENLQTELKEESKAKMRPKREDSEKSIQDDCELMAQESSKEQPSSSEGRPPASLRDNSVAAGNQYFGNTILDEVLSEKKMELLHAPEVVKFLQEKLKAAKP